MHCLRRYLRTTHCPGQGHGARRTPSRAPRAGQALVEVLVAISILTVGFMGVITLLSRAISLNRVVADNYTATYLAAEGIEVAKNIIDGNVLQQQPWNNGVQQGEYELDYRSTAISSAFAGRKLRFDTETRIYSYDGEVETPFIRKITVTPVGDGSTEVRVNSEVAWTGRGGAESIINLEDHFFNWR